MEDYIKTGQVAMFLGTSTQTIRNYEYKGLLMPTFTTEAGTRYYKPQDILAFREERLRGYEKNN